MEEFVSQGVGVPRLANSGNESFQDLLARFATKDDLNAFKDDVARRFDAVDRRFEAVDQRLDSVDHRLDAVEQRLDAVDRRLDTVDQRLDAVDQRLDAVDQRLEAVEQRLEEQYRHTKVLLEDLRADVKALFEGLDMRSAVHKLQERTDRLESDVNNLEVRVRALERRRRPKSP
ncbi:MAG TPA: hypothetical protein VF282_02450 [Bacillota bacterium]